MTYEELDQRLLGLQQAVPGYLAKRMAEAAICPDLDSAKKERASAEGLQQETVRQWESARESLDAARSVRDGLNAKHQESQIEFVSDYLEDGGPITEGLVREIQKRLVEGVRGGAAAPGE